jgi:hypothetical protein
MVLFFDAFHPDTCISFISRLEHPRHLSEKEARVLAHIGLFCLSQLFTRLHTRLTSDHCLIYPIEMVMVIIIGINFEIGR